MNSIKGRTVIIDYWVEKSVSLLSDLDFWKGLLKELIEDLGMTYVTSCGTEFSRYSDINIAGGISAVAILLESHLAVHTWPEYKYFHLVLDSCKVEFDEQIILRKLKKIFGDKEIVYKDKEWL